MLARVHEVGKDGWDGNIFRIFGSVRKFGFRVKILLSAIWVGSYVVGQPTKAMSVFVIATQCAPPASAHWDVTISSDDEALD
jgi:hypothetical protein